MNKRGKVIPVDFNERRVISPEEHFARSQKEPGEDILEGERHRQVLEALDIEIHAYEHDIAYLAQLVESMGKVERKQKSGFPELYGEAFRIVEKWQKKFFQITSVNSQIYAHYETGSAMQGKIITVEHYLWQIDELLKHLRLSMNPLSKIDSFKTFLGIY